MSADLLDTKREEVRVFSCGDRGGFSLAQPDLSGGPEHEAVVADEVVFLSRHLHARPKRSPD